MEKKNGEEEWRRRKIPMIQIKKIGSTIGRRRRRRRRRRRGRRQ
jgi:hypothetical protein